jgi:hypothetical protein
LVKGWRHIENSEVNADAHMNGAAFGGLPVPMQNLHVALCQI